MKERPGRGPEVLPAIFVGKWTVKIMYSLKKTPQRHGQLAWLEGLAANADENASQP
jgi:DNA-binding HxlR family transcriptional regulator